ncbi:NAD(P)-binding protein [Hymenobacter sp. HMF4947]|uniref:Flavin-dependent monooxygenase n=1 Tax=Hymenobacter ginkgonis TaxID=2682976 RepID=A0A7K1T8U9_9BACT|nr:NAD(P)/FAD-dependent oxidoreductase [Hymenobacter ginkgonis]MVN74813.1 NAD(P)-binding protein [Hymenobacter ginkgonis]
MLIQDKKIAIIGGGPGGLTLARLLQLRGATVKVYERDRDRDVRVQGATLDLHHESGLAALRQAGLLDEFKKHYRPGAEHLRLVDQHATLVLDEHAEAQTATFGDPHFRPEIDRGPLRDLLLDSLQPGTVVWDSHFASMKPAGPGWEITFQNGTATTADIVVGADGANSKIRPFVTPVTPFYIGITVVEGALPDAAQHAPRICALLQGGKIFALGDEKTLIVSAKGDGGLAFYTGCKTPELWARDSGIDFKNAAQVQTWFRQEFVGWASLWDELFAADHAYFVPRPQYCFPPTQAWASQPNLTLLGDAAHLMPPYAGEGVNMAMLDALELSNCLADSQFSNAQAAIAAYEQSMRQRAATVAQETLAQTAALHSPGGLAHLVELFSGGEPTHELSC